MFAASELMDLPQAFRRDSNHGRSDKSKEITVK
jgi:hypothetical protein